MDFGEQVEKVLDNENLTAVEKVYEMRVLLYQHKAKQKAPRNTPHEVLDMDNVEGFAPLIE